jgi:hypothetical protein
MYKMNFNSSSNLSNPSNISANVSANVYPQALKAAVKVQPVHIKYRMINLNFVEKDGTVIANLTTGCYPIQSQYNPNNSKGHTLTIKIECHPNDRQKIYETQTELLFTINSELNWIVALVENENNITIEIHSGSYPMLIDQSNKLVLHHGNNIGLQNNNLSIKIVPPYTE